MSQEAINTLIYFGCGVVAWPIILVAIGRREMLTRHPYTTSDIVLMMWISFLCSFLWPLGIAAGIFYYPSIGLFRLASKIVGEEKSRKKVRAS